MACAACSTTAGRRSWSARSTARPAAGRAMDSTSSKRKSVTGRTPRSYYYPVILSHPRNIKMKNKILKTHVFKMQKSMPQKFHTIMFKTTKCHCSRLVHVHCSRLQHVIVQDYNMSLFKTTTCHCSRLQHVHCSRLQHVHCSRLQHVIVQDYNMSIVQG